MRELVEALGVEGVETISVIKDRNTGQSRGFGFARFSTVALAKKFLSDHYPALRMFADEAKVKVAFSRTGGIDDRGRRGRDGEDEWICRVCMMLNFSRRVKCFQCGTQKSEITLTGHLTHPTPTFFQNDGSRDVEETTASQFLLFRELAEGVGEEMLAKGVQKLLATAGSEGGDHAAKTGAREGTIRRVLLVRDRKSGESWRFGFVEFAGVEDSKAAHDKYLKMDRFTIASKPVLVSFIHSGVFVPVYNPPPNAKNLGKYTFMGSNGLRLAYWDEEGYISEVVVGRPEPLVSTTAAANPSSEKATESAASKSKKRKADTEKASAASAAPTAAKKAIPSHLQFWQDRHMELHGVAPSHSDGEPGATSETDSTSANKVKKKRLAKTTQSEVPASTVGTTSAEGSTAPADGDPPTESFADLNRMACLLCVRQFKVEAEVHKHERLSTLHRMNLQNETLVATARAKLAKLRAQNPESAIPAYRDRAKERRAVFGQPKRPEPIHATSTNDARATASASPEPPQPPSKGAALLSKMGWTSGAGLGVEGKGITAPVVAEMYAEGVGLGAKGGKVGEAAEVAGMNTAGGYKDFVKRTKEKAKERYESMS